MEPDDEVTELESVAIDYDAVTVDERPADQHGADDDPDATEGAGT